MPINTLLPQASSWSGLRRLLSALEVRGEWHPLDPQGFATTPAAEVLRMATLDAQHTLPWITLSARDGRPAARAVARARAALGRPAAIACLDVARRRLVLDGEEAVVVVAAAATCWYNENQSSCVCCRFCLC